MQNILIADDSADLPAIVRSIYSRRNIFISEATSKAELLSSLSRMRPDLILLDVILDSDDGRVLCKELKLSDDYKTIPIILISGDPEKLLDPQEVFADGILQKPFRVESVLSKIKEVINKYAS